VHLHQALWPPDNQTINNSIIQPNAGTTALAKVKNAPTSVATGKGRERNKLGIYFAAVAAGKGQKTRRFDWQRGAPGSRQLEMSGVSAQSLALIGPPPKRQFSPIFTTLMSA
jgi:hypothetical protein